MAADSHYTAPYVVVTEQGTVLSAWRSIQQAEYAAARANEVARARALTVEYSARRRGASARIQTKDEQ